MPLDKAIQHGKERRKPYRRSGQFDRTCRPGGSCPHCLKNRTHQHRKAQASARDREDHEQA